MTMPTATTTPDFYELEREALSRREELRDQRSGLSLEALTDPTKADHLAELEKELEKAERSLEQVKVAAAEHERREAQSRADAERVGREEALTEALDLQAKKRAAAERVDETARAFAEALTAYSSSCLDVNSALATAGENPRVDLAGAPETALRYAMNLAGTPRMIDFAGMSLRTPPKPLAEAVPPVPGENGEDLAARAARPVPAPAARAEAEAARGADEREPGMLPGVRRVPLPKPWERA